MSKRKYNFPILIGADTLAPYASTAFSLKTKVPAPTEAYEASRLVDYMRAKKLPFTHVANETTSKLQGARNKRAGVSKGFPDFLICLPGKLLCIELKRKRGGRISPEQKQWLVWLNSSGCRAIVCYGFEDAKTKIEEMLA